MFFCFQELEKKFSQTGAYKNMKKMLSSKNDQVEESDLSNAINLFPS